MENNESLLSICIPTFNRDKVVMEFFGKFAPIAHKYNIPIYISDNASTDKTCEVIMGYTNRYNNIYYYQQKENIGPDRNTEFVLKSANTKYRWLIGDTTEISESALVDILNDLTKNEYDIYIINSVIRPNILFREKVYTDKNELLSELGWHMTYISSQIYDKKIVDNAHYERYYGSRFLQTGIIFEYLNTHTFSAKMNPDICVGISSIRDKNHWSRSIPIEIFCKDWYLFVMSLPTGYLFESKKKCILDHGIKSSFFLLKPILEMRANKLLSIKVLFKYKFFISQTIQYPFVLLFFIVCIPSRLLVLLIFLYKATRRNCKE